MSDLQSELEKVHVEGNTGELDLNSLFGDIPEDPRELHADEPGKAEEAVEEAEVNPFAHLSGIKGELKRRVADYTRELYRRLEVDEDGELDIVQQTLNRLLKIELPGSENFSPEEKSYLATAAGTTYARVAADVVQAKKPAIKELVKELLDAGVLRQPDKNKRPGATYGNIAVRYDDDVGKEIVKILNAKWRFSDTLEARERQGEIKELSRKWEAAPGAVTVLEVQGGKAGTFFVSCRLKVGKPDEEKRDVSIAVLGRAGGGIIRFDEVVASDKSVARDLETAIEHYESLDVSQLGNRRLELSERKPGHVFNRLLLMHRIMGAGLRRGNIEQEVADLVSKATISASAGLHHAAAGSFAIDCFSHPKNAWREETPDGKRTYTFTLLFEQGEGGNRQMKLSGVAPAFVGERFGELGKLVGEEFALTGPAFAGAPSLAKRLLQSAHGKTPREEMPEVGEENAEPERFATPAAEKFATEKAEEAGTSVDTYLASLGFAEDATGITKGAIQKALKVQVSANTAKASA